MPQREREHGSNTRKSIANDTHTLASTRGPHAQANRKRAACEAQAPILRALQDPYNIQRPQAAVGVRNAPVTRRGWPPAVLAPRVVCGPAPPHRTHIHTARHSTHHTNNQTQHITVSNWPDAGGSEHKARCAKLRIRMTPAALPPTRHRHQRGNPESTSRYACKHTTKRTVRLSANGLLRERNGGAAVSGAVSPACVLNQAPFSDSLCVTSGRRPVVVLNFWSLKQSSTLYQLLNFSLATRTQPK